MIRVAILGASGYVGGELMRLIAGHPAMEVGVAFGASNAGQPVAAVHPHLALAYPDMAFEAWDPALLNGCDLVLAALPHGETQRLADELLAPGTPFVDLGADFRLDSAAEYERWYGEPHARPDLLGSFVYGLPEFRRAKLAGAKRVAAPGCYPTAASAGAEAAGRRRRWSSATGSSSMPPRASAAPARGASTLSARSKAISAPTACSITATPPKCR